MKKVVQDLSPIIAFFFTAAVMSFLSYYVLSFLQSILEATPNQQLLRGF